MGQGREPASAPRHRRAFPRGPLTTEGLGEWFREDWEASGLTQDDYGALYGVSGQGLRLWFRGENLNDLVHRLIGFSARGFDLRAAAVDDSKVALTHCPRPATT